MILYMNTSPLTGAVSTYGFGLGGESYAGVQMDEPPRPLHKLLPVRGNPYTMRRNAPVPVYAELERLPFPKDCKLDVLKNATWSEALKAVSQHLDIPLFSDHFSFLPTPYDRGNRTLPDLTRMNLPAALDALCDRYHYLWWYEGGSLFFRSRAWFIERQYEVPPPVLDFLQKQLQEQGRLNGDGLDALSRLTRRQLQGLRVHYCMQLGGLDYARSNLWVYRRLRNSASRAHDLYGYLQIYATFRTDQKRKALSTEGLAFAEMNVEQQRALYTLLMVETASELVEPLKRIQFLISQQTLIGPKLTGWNGTLTTTEVNSIGGAVGVTLTLSSIRSSTRTLAAPTITLLTEPRVKEEKLPEKPPN
jgi:hypothetical protein